MKKGLLKKLAGIALVVAMMTSLAACGTASAVTKDGLAGLKKKGTIVIGMEATTPPYEYHPETISLTGVVHNLIPVTLGNLVGGVGMMGFMYYHANKPFFDEADQKAE